MILLYLMQISEGKLLRTSRLYSLLFIDLLLLVLVA